LSGFTREAIGNLLEAVAALTKVHVPQARLVFLGNPPDSPLPADIEQIDLDWQGIGPAREALKARCLVAGANAWSLFKLFEQGKGPGGDGPTARVFGLTLIDEASQLLVGQGLMSLAGLAEGGRVVVAGDDRQLPPVRQVHEGAGPGGLEVG